MTVAVTTGMRTPDETRNILGVDVAVLDCPEAIHLIGRKVRHRDFTRVGFLNAHVANIAQADPEFLNLLRRFLILPDGVGVDIASKTLYGDKFPANLNGTDFVPALLKALPGKLQIALIGAQMDNALAAADRLARIAPQHDFRVISDGYFDSKAEPDVLASLSRSKPDILLVAMGVPRQENWIAKLTPEHATVAIAVGALFDFLSGAVPRAPEWMRRARLEWLFRLILEPGRLWRRYVVGNPVFLMHLARQRLLGRKR